MATTYERITTYDIGPDDLVGVMADAGYLEAQERHFGALEVHVRREDGPSGPVFVVDKTEPGRGPTGKKDPSRPEASTLTQRWDLAARSCTWELVNHKHRDRVKVHGTTTIEPDGEGARVVERGTIEIDVPFVGKKLEKKFCASIERKAPKFREFLWEWIQRH